VFANFNKLETKFDMWNW